MICELTGSVVSMFFGGCCYGAGGAVFRLRDRFMAELNDSENPIQDPETKKVHERCAVT